MFNHGLTAGDSGLFLSFIERRTGGLRGRTKVWRTAHVAPVFCGLMGIALFSRSDCWIERFRRRVLIFKARVSRWRPWATAVSCDRLS